MPITSTTSAPTVNRELHIARDLRRYAAEALGTGVLVFVGSGSIMLSAATNAFGHVGVSLAFGGVVAVLVASLGTISGAHINPAVTFAFWSVRRFPARDVIPYIAAQCMGATLAAYLLQWLFGLVGSLGATVPSVVVGLAFAVEAGFSLLLGLVIFFVATNKRISQSVAPFVIGATVFIGALITGPFTGGSFNPARSLGPAIAAGVWRAHWMYWAAPIAGMLLAAQLYQYFVGTAPPDMSVPHDVVLGVEGPVTP